MNTLPQFRYHPDPVRTGMIQMSERQCQVCNQTRGYMYTGNVYSRSEIEHVCPWCIASGEAAARLDATFADGHQLAAAGISTSIIDEVTTRTPGYQSWQSEVWLAHCNDACEFHGDAQREDLQRMDPQKRARIQSENLLLASDWEGMVRSYQPGGQPAFYKFLCRHCKAVLYHTDYT